jgi:xanthine dehydrogenase molybdopterin-binding subunit B
MGLFTLEEIIWGNNDNNLKKGFLISDIENYKIPIIKDIPREFSINLLPNSKNDIVIYSSKAIGEPPFFLGFFI